MICLHSGYCCIHLDVIIVTNPALGIIEDNLEHKPTGVKCRHLVGNASGEYTCAIHDFPWYQETPCYAFTQIEQGNTECRLGVFYKNSIKLQTRDKSIYA